MMYRREIPFPDMGISRATAQYVLSKRWFTPIPSTGTIPGVGSPSDMWFPFPQNFDDAGQAIVGARTGFLIPGHAQKSGSYGIDHFRHVRNDQPKPQEDYDEWL